MGVERYCPMASTSTTSAAPVTSSDSARFTSITRIGANIRLSVSTGAINTADMETSFL